MGLTKQLGILRQIKMLSNNDPQMDDYGEFSVLLSEIHELVDGFLRDKKDLIEKFYEKQEAKK